MSTIFVGGSRHVSRLPAEVGKRLDNVVASGHRVVVGDANGADKAVQKRLLDARYDKVTVFCSGDRPRNNLASWEVHPVEVPKGAKGFQFYAAKDRAMAQEADFGLMIWDGKSPGTVLNVLRLVRAGKIAVLFSVPDGTAANIKSTAQWQEFLVRCSPDFRRELEERATADEWNGMDEEAQQSFLRPLVAQSMQDPSAVSTRAMDEALSALNSALASGDPGPVMGLLGSLARERGMSQVARETGLARESLYRSLDAGGNPEFATILKVLSSIGLRLEAKPASVS